MKTVSNAFLRENSMCQTKCTSPGYWVIDQDRNCVSVFYWNRKGKMKLFFLEDLLLTEPGYLLCLFTRVVAVWGFLVGDFFERVTGDKHSDIFESKFCLFFSAHTNTHHFFSGLPPERSLRILSLLFCVPESHTHSSLFFPPQPMPWWSLKSAALRSESWSPKLWSCTAQVSSLACVVTRLKMMSRAGILESDLLWRRAFASWLPSHSHLTSQTSAISLLSKFYCFFTLI